jgi:hypothetical protein
MFHVVVEQSKASRSKISHNFITSKIKMFRFVALLVAFASAAAFSVSSSRAARSYSLKMGFEDAIGAQAPLGSLTHEHFSSKDSSKSLMFVPIFCFSAPQASGILWVC